MDVCLCPDAQPRLRLREGSTPCRYTQRFIELHAAPAGSVRIAAGDRRDAKRASSSVRETDFHSQNR